LAVILKVEKLINKKICFWIILIGLLVLRAIYWEKIATKSLYDFDEARYAEIAKNIIKTNNWLIPMAGGPDDPPNLNYFKLQNGIWLHPYFWKPPLQTQIIALSYKIFGINELTVRLPSFVLAIASLGIVYLLGNRLFNDSRVSFLSVILLVANNDFSYLSSQGVAEMQLLFFNLLTIYLLLKNKYKLAGVAFGLAILTKSFAVFWVIPIGLMVIKKDNYLRNVLYWLVIGLMIALPWHLLMYYKFGNDFIINYLVVNTVGRSNGSQSNIAPFYWYVKYAIWQWKSYLILLPFLVFFRFNRKLIFLIIWMVIIFVPFSLIKSKVWWYIFPFWVPFCLLMAFLAVKTKYWLVIIGVWFMATSFSTYNQSKTRTDWNLGLKELSLKHGNLYNLAVYGIPYESPLYYFNTGVISRIIDKETEYVITNKDYYQQLGSSWRVVDEKSGDILMTRN
jgi:4-amino-4-deoxy-L-arabinose transferase-like glycosyltransferase